MKIIKNPNWTEQQHSDFLNKIKENDGYCPCSLIKDESTKCICEKFIESDTEGECHCGRYIKTEEL